MRTAEDIKRLIKNAKIIINPEIKKAALNELINELKKLKMISSATTKPTIWRINMKSPITKLAATAAIIIVCFTGLHFWKSTGSGIALADVLTRINKVTAYSYKMQTTINTQERISTILVSKDYGIKIVQIKDPNNPDSQPGETYILPQQNAMVFIDHKEKFYTRIKFNNDSELEDYKEQNNDPNIIVKNFLSCQYTRLGISDIDGIKVEGFRTTDPNYSGGFAAISDFMGKTEKISVELWVDVKTLLPVRLVEDSLKRYSPKKTLHFHEVSSDFQWNMVVNPDDFNPVKPEGYISIGDDEGLVFPDSDEENAIKGFKLFADAFGKYPVNLETIGKEYRTLSGLDRNSYKDMSDEERNRKTSEVMQVMALGLLYRSLTEENKEPVYYGQTVGPDDSDKMLLRWKLDDGQYRVIFGDLNVKTVTADELAELEKP